MFELSVGAGAGAAADVVMVLLDCRFAKAMTFAARFVSARANASNACRFEVNTPSLKCGYTACRA